jgi:hypothetical protein
MVICEFCLLHSREGACRLGLNTPKTMKCREFAPGIEKFCAQPADFVSPNQIVEMARYFGIERTELKKVKLMAEARVAEKARDAASSATVGESSIAPQ